MVKKLIHAITCIIILGMAACGYTDKASLLDNISGVWRANNEQTLMTIHYSDKSIRLLFGDTFVPVSIGEIDEQNRTVNLNIKSQAGKSVVWTIRQIWDNKEKTTFHLGITLHDGTQEDFSFVRNITADDISRVAHLEPRIEPTTVAISAQQGALSTATARNAAPTQETKAPTDNFAPSFDCEDASNPPERLICSDPNLAALDVELMQIFRKALASSTDKDSLRKEQNEWRKGQRDVCSTSECVLTAYKSRIEDLEAIEQYLSKSAQFR